MPGPTPGERLTTSIAAFALSSGAAMAAETWPNLPVAVKNGIAARVGDVAYVGLGSAGSAFHALDLADPAGWVKRAPFPGPATNGAAVATSGKTIYAFSGDGMADADAEFPVIFDTAYAYDTEADTWSKLDTQTPVGLSGARAVTLGDGRIAIVGGYNKEMFDTYVAELGAIDKDKDPQGFKRLVDSYMGMQPRDYRWNDQVLVYDPAGNGWGTLGDNPFLPNCDPSVVTTGQDRFLVISGEIKPGLRTLEVKELRVEGQATFWRQLADLPPISDAEPQEGVAGAYAGMAGGDVIVAGGANFKGTRANAGAGKWFAHDGLKKGWRDEVYAFDGNGWRLVGSLPHGLAYGASFSVPGGVLVVGGEDGDGNARSEVFLLKWDGRKLSVEN